MKRIYYSVPFLILLFVPHLVVAQITIPESYFTGRVGTTDTITLYQFSETSDVSSITAAAGASQTWDFSGYAVTDTFAISETYIALPAELPGSDFFTESDIAIRVEADSFTTQLGEDGGYYLYQSIADGALWADGSFFIGDFDMNDTLDTIVTEFVPPSRSIQFPVEYESTWDDSSGTVITFGEFTIPGFSARKSATTVDGWGTIVTPAGSYQALRIRTDVTIVNLLDGSETPTSTDYEFLTLDNVFASVFVGADGSIDVSYSIISNEMSTPVEDEDGLPGSFQLAQNYPNPFNPTTTISYTLPATSEVTLTVYTLTGQEVNTLVQSTQGAGSYSVSFDAGELASGLYLYRLETESFTETRLMSLIK